MRARHGPGLFPAASAQGGLAGHFDPCLKRECVPQVAGNLRHGASEARQEVLADCGHYVSEERPAELASLLLSFFD
jgi:pimeloyl-ACP methyl ester carboxylesterase